MRHLLDWKQVQDLTIIGWIITKEEQLTKVNLRTKENVQQVKVNVSFESIVIEQLIELLKEFKDVFAQTYKDLKVIPLEISQHKIEFDTIVPLAH